MMLEGSPTRSMSLLCSLLLIPLLGATLAGIPAASAGADAMGFTTALVIFGTEADADTIWAEVARTEEERARGLMFRDELGENEGMLFVLPDYEAISFWMKDTYIPLDIAFMDPTFRITGIKQMEPLSEELVDSPGRIQFALEVNEGWFEEHGVRVDDRPQVVFGG